MIVSPRADNERSSRTLVKAGFVKGEILVGALTLPESMGGEVKDLRVHTWEVDSEQKEE